MGIFSRKKRPAKNERRGRHAAPEPDEAPEVLADRADRDEFGQKSELTTTEGPFDVADAPEDELPRIDLGSVRVPVPEGAQVQVEMEQSDGSVRAVHVVVPQGQVTIASYAAPRSGGIWPEIAAEITEQLKSDGAKVTSGAGEWGQELSAMIGETTVRFVGVDGPRWMLRGVIASPPAQAAQAVDVLRQLMRQTIVDRGDSPMPVRTPLPIVLPPAVAEHIAEQRSA